MRLNQLLLIFLILLLFSCGVKADSEFQNSARPEENNEKPGSQAITLERVSQDETGTPLPIFPIFTPTRKPVNTTTATPTLLPTSTATQTPTIQLTCPAAEGYIWAEKFSENKNYITNILPAVNLKDEQNALFSHTWYLASFVRH